MCINMFEWFSIAFCDVNTMLDVFLSLRVHPWMEGRMVNAWLVNLLRGRIWVSLQKEVDPRVGKVSIHKGVVWATLDG